MKAMRYAVGAMTGLVIAATFYEAWFGSELGLVLIGFSISVAGICGTGIRVNGRTKNEPDI